ncbi:TetR/AcrR family transcriptional regulator [Gordonia sp. CPCC 206044]|uniref:TetR/AcrR family transcriptional regulator n=1 Tax=Gordonia sp. CPCC 206044 TaxID=3140793 RepID=UPI003AF3BADC
MRSRDKIVEATLGLIADAGFSAVNIAAVADRAGVSRQTVYSNFGTREDMVAESLTSVMVTVTDMIHERLNPITEASDYLVEFIVIARSMMRDNPFLSALMTAQEHHPLFDTGASERTMVVARELLAPIVELDPRLAPHLDEIVEVAAFVGMSLIVFGDSGRTDAELRVVLDHWIRPAMSAFTADAATRVVLDGVHGE